MILNPILLTIKHSPKQSVQSVHVVVVDYLITFQLHLYLHLYDTYRTFRFLTLVLMHYHAHDDCG